MEPEGSLPHSRVPIPIYTSPLPHMRSVPRPSHYSRFYHPNNTGRGVWEKVYTVWRKKNRCFSNNCNFVYFQYKKNM
jgi:hypothetical protein